MSTRLLHTKCYLPSQRVGAVLRPRLDAQLQAGLLAGHRLTAIVAPAGYGKTTLAAEWVRHTALPSAWLTLDSHDNDLIQVLRYLQLALRRLLPAAGEHVQAVLDAHQFPPQAELVAALIDDLEAVSRHVDGRIILALDDYHQITHPPIHDLLRLLVAHLPPPCHLLLISREDPPLPLPRLRARGELTEIRAQDLRFTAAEMAHFFAQTLGHSTIGSELLATLEQRTEGWIASLQLAALSLQGRSPDQTAAFIHAFGGSHRFIFDYLAEEVLTQQPPEVRRFLQMTSVLERFQAPLCQAVTGYDDSAAMLQRLEQANLFLVPLDNERIWYRYHHLFADYLRSGVAPHELPRLYTHAARWCADHGLWFEGVQYALECHDLDLTALVVERALSQAATWSGGELAMLVRWIDALPGQVLRMRPRLSLDASRALFLSGRPMLAAQLLDQAEATLRATACSPEAAALLATAEVYRAALAAFHGEIRRAITLASAAQPRLPATALLIRARAADALGLAYGLEGNVAQSERCYLQAGGLATEAGVNYLAINARCEAALAQLEQGRLDQAMQTCRQALALISEAPIPPAGLALTILGAVAYEQNDLMRAEHHLREGMALSQQGGLRDDLRLAQLMMMRLGIAQGDLGGAATALEQAIGLLPIAEVPRLERLAAAWRAELNLYTGDVAAAWRWACDYLAWRQNAVFETSQDSELLALARISLVYGDLKQALEVTTMLEQQALPAGRVRTALAALILQTCAYYAAGERDSATQTLSHALRLAAPEGFMRLFLDAGASLADLLPAVRAAAPGLVARLEAVYAARPLRPLPPGPDTLSEQEMRVLLLVVAGKSNYEIATELVITPGTAKWHVHNILQKLGVNSRPKAIALARELGLA